MTKSSTKARATLAFPIAKAVTAGPE